jgi:hypothetical protein
MTIPFGLLRYGSSRKKRSDGFKHFHYDYQSSKGGHNDVFFTIVVNLGVFDLEDNVEEEEEEEGRGEGKGEGTEEVGQALKPVPTFQQAMVFVY